ncbi:hypothetical protein [Leptolyngbya sp. NIES-2104]|nr:hypothetical protein [Leptolyngbya sp. NIES-2104]GAP96645.1 hypothetical protein NIES2104_31880 [Leptolyngbya sp. NIES-2104]
MTIHIKRQAGRKQLDVMFKLLVLQQLYTISDNKTKLKVEI